MSESGTACVICARDAEQGYLCANDYGRLGAVLRQIEEETAILDATPSMQQRTDSGGGGLPSQRSPIRLDALVALDPRRGLMRWASDDFDPWGLDDTASVVETLFSRARTVEEESGETMPPPTVSGLRDYLTTQLPWIARQPWVDEMFIEMRELLGQLQRTNKTQDEKPVGLCHLPRFESTCGGRIWQREQERYLWRQAEPGSDRCVRIKVKVSDGPAYCERCRATWDDPKELDRLHLIEEQRKAELARPRTHDGRRMVTEAEAAALVGKKLRTFRVWAWRNGIKAISGHFDPEWFGERDATSAAS